MNKYIILTISLILAALLSLNYLGIISEEPQHKSEIEYQQPETQTNGAGFNEVSIQLKKELAINSEVSKAAPQQSLLLEAEPLMPEVQSDKTVAHEISDESEEGNEYQQHKEKVEAKKSDKSLSKKELAKKAKEAFDRLPDRMKELYKRSREAAKKGEWGEFLYAVQDIYAENPRLILGSRYISQAIQYDAPIWVFERLLTYGELFNYAHTLQLARSDKLSLALKLLPLGLDLHAKSSQGENGVHASTAGFRGYRILPLFLYHNVDAESIIGGMDPLQYSLSKVTKTNKAFMFIKILIYEGKVEIKEHHRETIEQVRLTNPAKYERLITEVPELELF